MAVPDCDDDDGDINPAAIEYCDGLDNDCDGTDDPDSSADAVDWYTDADGDGYADPTSAVIETSCYGASGLATDNTDCDDGEAEVHPGADETCNSRDDDCDSATDEDPVDGDEYTLDADGDGFGEQDGWYWGCDGADNDLDCDDSDPTEPHVVDGGSATTSPSGSADDPWLTIQDGIDSAGKCVAVFPGTYGEALDFNGHHVDVRSVYGASLTTIDASGLRDAVASFQSGESSDAGLAGFTLTGGEGHVDETILDWTCQSDNANNGDICSDIYQTWCGGGIYVNGASPTLRELVIEDNQLAQLAEMEIDSHGPGGETYMTYSFGGGVCVMNATLTLTDLTVVDNYADQGGGAWIDESSSVTWNRSSFHGNEATDGGGLQVDGGTLTATNLLVGVNLASGYGGGVMVSDGTAAITNSTIGLNTASTAEGLFVYGTSSVTLANGIFYGRGSGTGIYVDSGGTLTASYTDVYGFDTRYDGVSDPSGADGNIDEDPQFTDVTDDANPDNDDWSLGSGSPCIDAGDPDSGSNDADGSPNDMGVYGGPDSDWAE